MEAKRENSKELSPYKDLGHLYLPMEDVGEKDDMLKKFPLLKEWKEFTNYEGKLDLNKVIKYINFLYSIGTTLTKKYKMNIVARKEEAATLAGFNLKKDVDVITSELFAFKNKCILRMVVGFIRAQPGRDYVWESIIAHEQMYWELSTTTLESLVGEDENKKIASMKKKSELFTEKEAHRQALKGLYKEFFGDDFELEQVFKSDELMLTTPEEIATIPRSF